jgi:glyoxylase-like metal-dependent hydrolase (beta-lactamase superfamily II)
VSFNATNNAAQYGSASVHRIIDIDPFTLPLSFLFPGASIEALGAGAAALDGTHIDAASNGVHLAVQSHLIRYAGKVILMDTCVGEHKPRPARPAWHQRSATPYLANLAACGCSPDDVDVVMCTHLHTDHVGWNTRLVSGKWVPTFAKARYLMSQAELDLRASEVAHNPAANHGSYLDSVLPIVERGLVDIVKGGDAIADGATIVALPGHTPGQIGLEIATGARSRALFCGDAIHSPAQVYQPQWFSAFCHDGEQAVQTRNALLARAVAEDMVLIPAHLRAAHMRIREKDGGLAPVFDV